MHTTTVATTAPRKSRPSTRICELGSTGASSNLVVSTASKPETPTRPFKVRGTDQVSRLPFDQDPPKCIKFFKLYTEKVIKMQRKVEFVELHTLSLSVQRAEITKTDRQKVLQRTHLQSVHSLLRFQYPCAMYNTRGPKSSPRSGKLFLQLQ